MLLCIVSNYGISLSLFFVQGVTLMHNLYIVDSLITWLVEISSYVEVDIILAEM